MLASRLVLFVALIIGVGADNVANAQSSKFRCQRIDAIDDNPKSKHKWQHFSDDTTLQKRVFYIDAPCSDVGPAYYATGGGFEFNKPYVAINEYGRWTVIGSIPVDQTPGEPAKAWRCIAAWTGSPPGSG